MAKIVYRMPDGSVHVSKDLVKREKIKGTKYIQDKKTGRLVGRRDVKSGGDVYERNRVEKPFIIVKRSNRAKGHIRRNGKTYEPGQFTV
jgi:hypothetical protein